MDKIRVAMADYFKTITLFLRLDGENSKIEKILTEIKMFKPRKASEYDEIDNSTELFKAQDKDEDELNQEYGFYSKSFSKINKQMTK